MASLESKSKEQRAIERAILSLEDMKKRINLQLSELYSLLPDQKKAKEIKLKPMSYYLEGKE